MTKKAKIIISLVIMILVVSLAIGFVVRKNKLQQTGGIVSEIAQDCDGSVATSTSISGNYVFKTSSFATSNIVAVTSDVDRVVPQFVVISSSTPPKIQYWWEFSENNIDWYADTLAPTTTPYTLVNTGINQWTALASSTLTGSSKEITDGTYPSTIFFWKGPATQITSTYSRLVYSVAPSGPNAKIKACILGKSEK